MMDHLTRAKELRLRAAKCQNSAQSTSSVRFGDCYRLLAEHYFILANLEEEFVQRQITAATENRFIAADSAARNRHLS